jgi:hypothetical protein
MRLILRAFTQVAAALKYDYKFAIKHPIRILESEQSGIIIKTLCYMAVYGLIIKPGRDFQT